MLIDPEIVASEIEAIAPLHADLLGDEGVQWIVRGHTEPQHIEGGSAIDLAESFRVVLEAFHYTLLLSAVLLHARELLRKQPDETHAIRIQVDQLVRSLNQRFPEIDDDKKDGAVTRLQLYVETANEK
jgi:hypothetical protein